MEEGVFSQIGSQKDESRQRSLANLRPIQPGEVRNPEGGRAVRHDLASFIRSQTNQGKELVEFALNVMRGNERVFAKMSDRLFALKWLADRAFGAVAPIIELHQHGVEKPVLDLTKLSPAEFDQFKALALKIAPIPDQDASGDSKDAPETAIPPKDVPKDQP